MKRIAVIGFGKIGQAVAANILGHGYGIAAIDRNDEIANSFANNSFSSNEPGIQDLLRKAYQEGRLKIGNQYSAAAGSDALIIAIPLLINESKEIQHEPFADCLRQLAPALSGKKVIVIETSVPVGYGRNTVVPVIEACGKAHGVDFLLAYSPERIKSGTMLEQLKLIPKVIGGVTSEATDHAYHIYSKFFPAGLLHKVENIESAEMLKLAGMIYRDINIALANQLAQFANAININFADLIPLINTDREANILQPGIGVGGHCTPVYPYFLMENFKKAGVDFTLAQQGRFINNGMASHALTLVKDKIVSRTALILGLSFRPNVKEDTLSTAYLLHEALIKEGFDVQVHDTEFNSNEIAEKGFNPVTAIYDTQAEVAFLVTMHREYENLDFELLAQKGVKHFVDGRNSIDRNKVEASGIAYYGIGR